LAVNLYRTEHNSGIVGRVAAAAAQPASGSDQRYITIDFDNVDINLFIKYVSDLLGKNFIVDKAVQGNVTIISPTKISEAEVYRVFESVLEVHGYTTVQAGAVIKILPSARARSENVEMIGTQGEGSSDDRVVTQLVRLQNRSPEEIKKIITPLVSQTSVLLAHDPSGMLIITETRSNIQKLVGIIEVLDVASREEEVAVIALHNGSAESIAKILTAMYQRAAAQQKGEIAAAGKEVKIVPYDRLNALVVMAGGGELERVKRLVDMLDAEVERAAGNIHVYYLQNATAAELAKVLTEIPEKKEGEDQQNKGKAAAVSKSVRIMADEETNSLIITASAEEYAVLEGVIQQLDIPRRMVYLEALIMEVDTDKQFDVGVQWAAGGIFDDETGIFATGFSGPNGYDLLPGISGSDPSLAPGFSFGIIKQGIKIGDVTFPNIGAVLKAYKTDSAINIISTPQILTTDNKKAEISVGENVPYITSRNTTASNQDYTQYEYKDVATKLGIVPHISQADTLRLEIETEVVRIKGNSSDTPTTYKRTASTTVILNDNDTIVIGGIIGQDATESEWKIPLLGDIPLLGWLFKTNTTSHVKTNMFIFVTPHIVRNPVDMLQVSSQKENAMGDVLPSVGKELHKNLNPQQSMRFAAHGYELLQKRDLDVAKKELGKALAADPGNPYALINMAIACELGGEKIAAFRYYQQVIATGTSIVVDMSGVGERKGVPLLVLAREGMERIRSSIPAP
jgi:general secretion pathway protein D